MKISTVTILRVYGLLFLFLFLLYFDSQIIGDYLTPAKQIYQFREHLHFPIPSHVIVNLNPQVLYLMNSITNLN